MPVSRRVFLGQIGAGAMLGGSSLLAAPGSKLKNVAAVVTVYRKNSHADVLVSRILQSHSLDNQGLWPAENAWPKLRLSSLYFDQDVPGNMALELSREHGFRLCETIAEAVTLGTGRVAVDGVLLVGEHGDYPDSPHGQTMYPRRRFFEETAKVFEASGRAVPVFSDKHLSYNWENAKWMYDRSRALQIPLMAGSSLPGTWRFPAIELTAQAECQQIAGLSFGPIEAYGFHGLEGLQSLAERRQGGESGVRAVQALSGTDVWKRVADIVPRDVLDAACGALTRVRDANANYEQAVPAPTVVLVEHTDGFRTTMIHDAGGQTRAWTAAWREGDGPPRAFEFQVEEERPFGHFGLLLRGIEQMIHSGRPTWPVERTLLVTGILSALMDSLHAGGTRIATPHLESIAYKPTGAWSAPVAPMSAMRAE